MPLDDGPAGKPGLNVDAAVDAPVADVNDVVRQFRAQTPITPVAP
jgi:hypothetical protein